MKLLFDENLSPKLPHLLEDIFPGSAHVRDCGLKGRADDVIWRYANTKGFIIVSKDADFHQRCLLYGPPSKFVWLRLGNCTREDLKMLLMAHEQDIVTFAVNPSESVLVL